MNFDGEIKAVAATSLEDIPSDKEIVAVSTDEGGEVDTKEITEAQKMQETMRILEEIPYRTEKGKLQEVDAYSDFFRPYISGETSFSELLQDNKINSKTLEFLREVLFSASDFSSSEDRVTKEPERVQLFVDIKKYVSSEIVNRLESIDTQNGVPDDNVDKDVKRHNKNNAFYVVSESLEFAGKEKKKDVEKWLEEHVEALLEIGPFISSEDGLSTSIFKNALHNILLHTEDPEVEKKYLQIALDLSREDKKNNSLDLSTETYSEIVGSILNRESKSLTSIRVEDSPQMNKELLSKTIRESYIFMKQERIAKIIVERFGLDSSIVEKWQQAKWNSQKDEFGVVSSWKESYGDNLQAMSELESKNPGSAKRLFDEYGIANFARYNKEMLLHQLEMSDKDTPYGIVVFPEADWNGAFFHSTNQLAEASLKLRMGGFETRIVEVGSQRELARRLLILNKKYSSAGNKFSFAIIGGHGEKEAVAFGEEHLQDPPPPPSPGENWNEENQVALENWQRANHNRDRGNITSEDILNGEGIKRAAKEFFEPLAPVVLVSCSTGAEGGIAEKASDELKWDISGPNIPTHIKKIDVIFDDGGKPVFDVKYYERDEENSVETNRYVAGNKIDNK